MGAQVEYINKTGNMCTEGESKDLILEDGQKIKSCDCYKYLGVIITMDGSLDTAIKERNMLGRKAISALNSILWDQHI